MIHVILLVVAIVCFLLVAAGVNGGRINLTGVGLAAFASAALAGGA